MYQAKEQLTRRAPWVTRKIKVAGGLAAGTLADLQVKPDRKWKSKPAQCRNHRWIYRRFTKSCSQCGLEDVR
ncbi:hypothetical protein GC207_14975 [bacterium]|nr:hypothetical protein [bacterium]